MKLNLLFLVLVVLTSLTAFSEDDHLPTVCSVQDAKVCGHIGHLAVGAEGAESRFVAHLEIPGGAEVTDLSVKLWMPAMGHGSSPVLIAAMGSNRFMVTEAYFIMAGDWEVIVQFKLGTAQHEIKFPIHIAN